MATKKSNTLQGGGANKLFKPLISTSLAFALGVSVASAESIDSKLLQSTFTAETSSTTNGPTSAFGASNSNNEAQNLSQLNTNITTLWTGIWDTTANDYNAATTDDATMQKIKHNVAWSSSVSNYWAPTYTINNTSGIDLGIPDNGEVDTLYFQFSGGSKREIKIKDGKVSYGFLMKSTDSQTFTFSNENTNRGIKANFIVGLANSDASWYPQEIVNSKATLNFASTTTDTSVTDGDNRIALYGDFVVQGGWARPNQQNNDTNVLVSTTFGGSLKGNLSIDSNSNFNSKTKVTFSSGDLIGNVSNKGTLILNLTSGKITGNILTRQSGDGGLDGLPSVSFITLSKDGASIDGGVIANTGGTNNVTFSSNGSIGGVEAMKVGNEGSAKNEITFTGNGSITGSTSTHNYAVNVGPGGTNIIRFNATSGTNSITGGINNNAATNTITSATGATLQLGTNTSSRINITSAGGGTANNTITADVMTAHINSLAANEWYGTNSNTITANSGTIDIATISDAGKGKNTINFAFTTTTPGNGSQTDSATANAGTSVLTIGSITSGNNIIKSYAGTNTIGAISGSNTITLMGATKNAITGNISGNNTITANNLLVGTQTQAVSMSNTGDDLVNANGPSKNQITTTDNLTAYFSTISVDGTAYSYAPAHQNIIQGGAGSIVNVSTSITATGKMNGTNSNSISADTIVVNGIITATGGGQGAINTLTINGANSQSSVSGDITLSGNGQNNFILAADNATLTLKGASNTITTLTAFQNASTGNTLTLDTTNNSVSASIATLTNGDKLAVILGGETNKFTKLTIGNNNAHIRSLTISAGTDNTLALSGTNTLIIDGAVSIEASKGVIFDLSSGSSLTFDNSGGLTTVGASTFKLGGGTNTIAGGTNGFLAGTGEKNFEFVANGTLTIGTTDSLATTTGTTNIKVADGISGTITSAVTTSATATTNIVFASGSTASTLALNKASGTHTISNIRLEGASTKNTLDISGATSLTTDLATIEANQALTIQLGDSTAFSANNFNTAKNGSSTIITGSGSTISGGTINVSEVQITGTGSSTLNLTASNINIATLKANATTGNTLVLDATNNAVTTMLHTIDTSGGNSLAVNLEGGGDNTKIATLNLDNLSGSINTLSVKGTYNALNISGSAEISTLQADANGGTLNIGGGKAVIENKLEGNGTNKLNLSLEDNATIALKAEEQDHALASLSGNGTVDLSMETTTRNLTRQSYNTRKQLTIGDYATKSNINFRLAVDTENKTNDKVIISASSGTTAKDGTTAKVAVIGDRGIFNITTTDNVVLVDASAKTETQTISVVGGESIIGGSKAQVELVKGSKNGEWIIGKVADLGMDDALQEVASTALTVNYDLFLANFNSLNKRMGELRENPHSNGVWARVFGGNMSNDFGAGSKTDYITAQAGYDYALTLGNAKNYIGVTVAYGKSWTNGNDVSSTAINGIGTFSLANVDSNMVEVGIYNSYVEDSGWYNDTIFKFDYIMSEFSLSYDPNTMSKTNNFAMVLSDEFGYRYKFAESEKGNWYVDPQVEVAFGYFNQSDFNRVVLDASANSTNLAATQDSILTLRTRAGLSLGKKFITEKGFASLYVGAFYEYDYINGGNAEGTGRSGGTVTQLDKIESNGRAILNVGSNIGLTESARLYIDVEKSFGDKQRTFMQFNIGARYSF